MQLYLLNLQCDFVRYVIYPNPQINLYVSIKEPVVEQKKDAAGVTVIESSVSFDLSGTKYSWTISGSSITGSNLKNVNLKVNKNTNNVPAAVLGDSAAKDMPNIQINLADHGLFGFTAGLKYYVGKEYAGQYANLLYYTDGRLEIQNSCPVDAEGYTLLTFTHASGYVIAMGANLSDTSSADTSTGDTNSADTNNVFAVKSSKTGDNNALGLYIAILMAGAAMVAVLLCHPGYTIMLVKYVIKKKSST